MQYRGMELTLVNFKEVLNDFDSDIADIVRLALIDGVDIERYIDKVNGDSYKLLQVKLSLQEGVEPRFIFENGDGDTIKLARKVIQRGLDLAPLGNYISPMGTIVLKEGVLNHVLSAYLENADISQIDFTKVESVDSAYEICEGLKLGYPLGMFQSKSAGFIKLIKKGMMLGYDMTVFAIGEWSEDKVSFILASTADFATLVNSVTCEFNLNQLYCINSALTQGYDIKDFVKVTGGKPVFTSYQMEEFLIALQQGVFTEELVNPMLSPRMMADVRMKTMRDKAEEWEG